MALKLSDAQLVLMSTAAQREDRCLVASQQLKGAVAKKVAEKLIGAGLVKEVRAKADTPVWRRDEEGRGFALKLTAEGLKAIAVEEEAGSEGGPSDELAAGGDADPAKRAASASAGSSDAAAAGPGRQLAPPRANTKLAAVIDLMLRAQGASIDELTAATGWLAHTTRAAITGLRKRNFRVSLDKADEERGSVYRLAAAESEGFGSSGEAPDIDATSQPDPASAAAGTGTESTVALPKPKTARSRRGRKPASDRLAA